MIRVQQADFDLRVEVDRLRQGSGGVGAIVTFIGVVRDFNEGSDVKGLFLEHYSGMTEKSIQKIADEACDRWDVIDYSVIHRVGELTPTDQIVLVAVSSPHRQDAFDACEFMMDYLKTRAPFWKKELTESGSRWLTTRDSDFQAIERWQESES